jgi:hypothetical protein
MVSVGERLQACEIKRSRYFSKHNDQTLEFQKLLGFPKFDEIFLAALQKSTCPPPHHR